MHTITHKGRDFRVEYIVDDQHGAPWKENDGHGPVSEWTTRDKKPGELVLNNDRHSRRYYDFAEAVRIAKRDRWGHESAPATATKNQKATIAARADFEYLRGWCNDEWQYVCVIVTAINNDGTDGETESLCGVDDLNNYPAEVARELADEICDTLTESEAAELAEIEASMQRTREHARAWLREYRAIVRELGARSFPTLCETARRNLQREILELNAMRHRARELRNLAALGA